MNKFKAKSKKIGAGVYHYRGFEVDKDEYEPNLWWVKAIGGDGCGNDHMTLKAAKGWIDQNVK